MQEAYLIFVLLGTRIILFCKYPDKNTQNHINMEALNKIKIVIPNHLQGVAIYDLSFL